MLIWRGFDAASGLNPKPFVFHIGVDVWAP
jgi:hypothetical protein